MKADRRIIGKPRRAQSGRRPEKQDRNIEPCECRLEDLWSGRDRSDRSKTATMTDTPRLHRHNPLATGERSA